MSKALVIKGTDFSTNKLTTVTIEDDVPCTGITLNTSTASVSTTVTLTATVTPANTTDTVSWSSSNTSIATVSGGVVTAVANGTAVITATCGTHSATCTVTVEVALAASIGRAFQWSLVGSYNDYPFAAKVDNASTRKYIGVGASTNNYPVQNGDVTGYTTIYPINIPDGATTIVASHQGFASLIVYFSNNEIQTITTDSAYVGCARCLDGETASSGYPGHSISGWTENTRTYTIPATEGINSFTLLLYTNNSSTYDGFDLEDISYTFGFE